VVSVNAASGAIPLVSYWEGPISWLERLCVRSMREAGHPVIVYSYDAETLWREGLGATEIRHADEVMDETHPANRYRRARRYDHFADVFRLELLRQDRGVWTDLDCLVLKPLRPREGFLFGRFNADWLNNAILMLPNNSAVLTDYYAGITAVPLRLPWSTPQRRVRRNLAALFGSPLPDPAARTNIGPRALTYYVKQHGLFERACPPAAFYPVQSAQAGVLVDSDDGAARRLIGEETEVVHAWHGNLRDLGALGAPPAASSYLGQARTRLGVT
jgi:hypothetical protein